MINIVKMVETCGGCPSQWDGWDDQGVYYYFRYRWGFLRIDKAPKQEEWVSGLAVAYGADPGPTETIFGEQIGDGMDGIMSYEELDRAVAGFMKLPVTFSYGGYGEEEEEEAS